jgi:hypothetical protein
VLVSTSVVADELLVSRDPDAAACAVVGKGLITLVRSVSEIDTQSLRTRVIGGFVGKSRSVTVLVALLMVFSVLSSPGGANASAAAKSKVTVATGSVTCRKVTGSISLSPPLRKGGTKPEKMTFDFHASDCTTSKSNVKHVKGGGLVDVVQSPTNACGGVVFSKRLQVSFAWTPKSVHSTSASFSGFSFLQNEAGQEGFTIPNTGGSASAAGSFAGKDHGKRSVVTLYTNLTIAKFRTACKSKVGLTGYKVISGTATFS